MLSWSTSAGALADAVVVERTLLWLANNTVRPPFAFVGPDDDSGEAVADAIARLCSCFLSSATLASFLLCFRAVDDDDGDGDADNIAADAAFVDFFIDSAAAAVACSSGLPLVPVDGCLSRTAVDVDAVVAVVVVAKQLLPAELTVVVGCAATAAAVGAAMVVVVVLELKRLSSATLVSMLI